MGKFPRPSGEGEISKFWILMKFDMRDSWNLKLSHIYGILIMTFLRLFFDTESFQRGYLCPLKRLYLKNGPFLFILFKWKKKPLWIR